MPSDGEVVVVKSAALKAEFRKFAGGDGGVDASEIRAIEDKFGLPLSISMDLKYWQDRKVTYEEFVDMLKRNGSISKTGASVKLQVMREDIDAAFREAGGSDGIIDFSEIERVEKKYGLPLDISGDMKYWQDMKITKDEFIDMLERSGNLVNERTEQGPAPRTDLPPPGPGEEPTRSLSLPADPVVRRSVTPRSRSRARKASPSASPQPRAPAKTAGPKDRVEALFSKHAAGAESISLAVLHCVVADLGGAEWPEARLAALVQGLATADGDLRIADFVDWCFA